MNTTSRFTPHLAGKRTSPAISERRALGKAGKIGENTTTGPPRSQHGFRACRVGPRQRRWEFFTTAAAYPAWSWAGTHRLREADIGVEPDRILIEMREAFDDARYWHDHATFPAAEIAVRPHHRLVCVHPYPTGNGRHTRMLTDVSLFARGEPRLTWGSSVLAGDSTSRRRYIDATLAATAHDIVPLLQYARS